MHALELVILLFIIMVAAGSFARRLTIPYPILLVLVGLALGAVPGLPAVRLEPDLVFLVFLPPILWAAAYFTSFRDFRFNLRPILLLSVGLVLVTTAAVAIVARALLPGLGWAEALALGAILSPPDAVAATAVGSRIGMPRRVVTILEGESLVNDAAALVLYRAAVGAMVYGGFDAADTVVQFALAGAGGVAVGLAVGWLVTGALRYTQDAFLEITITLLAPYVAWVLAERAHVSAVLACVTGGIYVRRHFSALVAPATRIQARAVWELGIFVLNGLIFILIGLQLRAVREALPPGHLGPLLGAAAWIFATLVVTRLVWVPLATAIPRWLSRALRARDPMPPWQGVALISWVAMRGVVSLAAALALPFTDAAGAPLAYRSHLVVLTFSVVVATLLVQGLSLAPLVRRLRLPRDESAQEEETRARGRASIAALERLREIEAEPWVRAPHAEKLRAVHLGRVRRLVEPGAALAPEWAQEHEAERRLQHEVLDAERRAVIELRDTGAVGDEILHKLEHELDVEALRAGIGELRTPGPRPPSPR